MVPRRKGGFEPFIDFTSKALLTSWIAQRFRSDRLQPFGVFDEPFADCQRTAEETHYEAGCLRIESLQCFPSLAGKLQQELTSSLRISGSFERFFPRPAGDYRFWHRFKE